MCCNVVLKNSLITQHIPLFMKVLVITGPPYSGKGTQCVLVEKTTGYKHISTGDCIRTEKENNTEIGKIVQDFDERGLLVPDEVMKDLLTQIIAENLKEKGIILDGYPRTTPQVDTLIRVLENKDKQINQVININVPKEELLKRAKERAKTSTRIDDKNEQTHIKRITIFEEETRPAIEYFRTKVTVNDVNGMGTIEETKEKIAEKLTATLF